MPLRSIPAVRKDRPPAYFFKGTAEQAKKVPIATLAKIFSDAAGEQVNVKSRNMLTVTSRFRQDVYEHANHMREEGIEESLGVFYTPAGHVALKISRSNNVFLIRQHPVLHGITYHKIDTFDALKRILRHGFESESDKSGNLVQNVFNVSNRKTPSSFEAVSRKRKTAEDSYSIEMLAPQQNTKSIGWDGHVAQSSPKQILRVLITLGNAKGKEEILAKKALYRQMLPKAKLTFLDREGNAI